MFLKLSFSESRHQMSRKAGHTSAGLTSTQIKRGSGTSKKREFISCIMDNVTHTKATSRWPMSAENNLESTVFSSGTSRHNDLLLLPHTFNPLCWDWSGVCELRPLSAPWARQKPVRRRRGRRRVRQRAERPLTHKHRTGQQENLPKQVVRPVGIGAGTFLCGRSSSPSRKGATSSSS